VALLPLVDQPFLSHPQQVITNPNLTYRILNLQMLRFALFIFFSLFSSPPLALASLILPDNLRFVSEFKYPLTNPRSTRVYQIKSPSEEVNEATTKRKKYVHDPLFLPSATCDEKNTLVCCYERPNGKYTCELVIILSNPLIREYAYQSTRECVDGYCRDVDLKDISLRPISAVKIESSISDYLHYARLENTYVPIVPGQEDFILKFVLPSVEYVTKFEKDILNGYIDYKCSFNDFNVKVNSYLIQWDHLMSTTFYAALDGIASGSSIGEGERIAYIHRDDLRELIFDSSQSLKQNNWIQNEARFLEQIENILIRMFPLIDTA
jgi:hypothetical protein